MKKAPNVTQEGISSVAVGSPFRHAAPDTVGGAAGALNNNHHTAKVRLFPDHFQFRYKISFVIAVQFIIL